MPYSRKVHESAVDHVNKLVDASGKRMARMLLNNLVDHMLTDRKHGRDRNRQIAGHLAKGVVGDIENAGKIFAKEKLNK